MNWKLISGCLMVMGISFILIAAFVSSGVWLLVGLFTLLLGVII